LSKERFLIEEVRRKKQSSKRISDREKADQLFASLFPAQQNFIHDPSKRKVAHCPRRAGKSHCVLIYGLLVSLYRPGSSTLICARTRGQAKGIYWRLLKRLCEEYDVDCQFKNMDLEVHFANGSVIYFSGADTTEEVDKYRGRSFDLVVIDEGKSYSKHLLDDFVYDVILRTLADTRGTLVIIGTPGTVENGLFWSLINQHNEYLREGSETKMKLFVNKFDPEAKHSVYHWSLHHWTGKDNTKMPHIWEDACKEVEENELSWQDPYVMREILGLPVADASNLVFCYGKLADKRCDWIRDPEGPHGLPRDNE
jgi:phage terminase large subunit